MATTSSPACARATTGSRCASRRRRLQPDRRRTRRRTRWRTTATAARVGHPSGRTTARTRPSTSASSRPARARSATSCGTTSTANGIQDPGEPGIDGVTLNLLKASDNSVLRRRPPAAADSTSSAASARVVIVSRSCRRPATPRHRRRYGLDRENGQQPESRGSDAASRQRQRPVDRLRCLQARGDRRPRVGRPRSQRSAERQRAGDRRA